MTKLIQSGFEIRRPKVLNELPWRGKSCYLAPHILQRLLIGEICGGHEVDHSPPSRPQRTYLEQKDAQRLFGSCPSYSFPDLLQPLGPSQGVGFFHFKPAEVMEPGVCSDSHASYGKTNPCSKSNSNLDQNALIMNVPKF